MRVAAVQMVSGAEVLRNLERATHWVEAAAAAGAELVLLPEYWCLMGHRETDKLSLAEAPCWPHDGVGAPDPLHQPLQHWVWSTARRLQIWLVAGSLPLQSPDPTRVLNTMLVVDPTGVCRARYDKVHLFSFSKGTESYDEARSICAGGAPVSVDLPCGPTVLSICYDLRFPEFFRPPVQVQAPTLILLSAAFTHTTGRAHWEILLRARAIENQCWLLASAQGGLHENGRRTWGQSLLISPWGEIVDQRPEGEGLVQGAVDLQQLAEVRLNLPALAHRRF